MDIKKNKLISKPILFYPAIAAADQAFKEQVNYYRNIGQNSPHLLPDAESSIVEAAQIIYGKFGVAGRLKLAASPNETAQIASKVTKREFQHSYTAPIIESYMTAFTSNISVESGFRHKATSYAR